MGWWFSKKTSGNVDKSKGNFSLSGPVHLKAVDWKNSDHRRSIAASLVKGVYVLEYDRLQKLESSQSNLPLWWESFHFRLIEPLVDDVNNSIFGAIYEFNGDNDPAKHEFNGDNDPAIHEFNGDNDPDQNPPKYVIAFRGVIKKSIRCMLRDLCELRLLIIPHKFEKSSRFKKAMEALRSKVESHGAANIWLAGHSMGSAIALHGGKTMAKKGSHVETYLFNPLFLSPSALIHMIRCHLVKQNIQIVGHAIKSLLALAIKDTRWRSRRDHAFFALSTWIPYLFVNPADHLGSGYDMYFQLRSRMEAGEIDRLATQYSTASLLLGVVGTDFEEMHRIPSANLTLNGSTSPNFKRAHGIDQWWNTNFKFESRLYQFR